MELPDTMRERVAQGAKILDEKEPDWFRKIDVATLDFSSYTNCVLGQLFVRPKYGDAEDAAGAHALWYEVAGDLLGLPRRAQSEREVNPIGMYVDPNAVFSSRGMVDFWREEIERRLSA